MTESSGLLAKSGPKGIGLWTHSKAVACCAVEMFGHPRDGPTDFGRAWLTFFGLDGQNASRFLKALLVASWLHDCGKANSGFQAVVRSAGEQRVRHEHVSTVFLLDQPIHDWLSSHVDLDIVIAAVLSHHLKANDDNVCHSLVEGDYSIEFLQGNVEFAQILESLATDCRLSPRPALTDKTLTRGQMMASRNQIRYAARRFQREIQEDDVRLRLLCAVKAGLVISNAAGSALVREGLDVRSWLRGCFRGEPLSGDFIEQSVIQPRIREIESRSDGVFQWRDWQLATGDLPARALLLSPCGSGKTLAASRPVLGRLKPAEPAPPYGSQAAPWRQGAAAAPLSCNRRA
jgi:CRISPR-associated endonuclease/helicase Cas3